MTSVYNTSNCTVVQPQESGLGSLHSVGLQYDQEHGHNPVTKLFFSPKNILFLQSQIEKTLTKWTGHPVRVPLSDELYLTMFEVASRNKWLAYAHISGLRRLNDMVIGHEVNVQYVSLRHKKLFEKYFITGDRMRVFPIGEGTKVTKGEVKVSSSGYMLTNPHKKHYQAFLSDVLDIGKPDQAGHA